MIPFGANLVGQVMTCPAKNSSSASEEYIRWILNDGVVPLNGINHCSGFKDKNGLCPLSSFVAGMQERISEADWLHSCAGNWTIPSAPNNIVNGKPQN